MAKVSDVYYSLGCSSQTAAAEKETAKVQKIYFEKLSLRQGTGKEGLSYCDKDYCNSSNLVSPFIAVIVAGIISVLVH